MRRLSTPPEGSTAFKYGRFSSDQQNPRSADDQLAEGTMICARQRWVDGGNFTDEGETGRSIINRPGLTEMLDRAMAGEADVIIVEDISRLGRNAADLHAIANRLKEAKVVIYTFSSGVLSGLDLSIRASMAEEASIEHGHRVKRGHRAGAKRGRVMGGIAYGYRLIQAREPVADGLQSKGPTALRNSDGGSDLKREIDPIQKMVVERIYRDFVNGISTHKICIALNAENVPGPGGGLWNSRRLTGDKRLNNGVLRNPIYVGRVVYGKSVTTFKSSTGKNKVTKGDVLDQIEEYVEELRIVSDELWDAAQERLERNAASIPNNARYPDYLLSGKVRCGRCREPYSVIGTTMGCTRRRRGAECDNRRRIKREDLEGAVLTGLKRQLLLPHILNLHLDEYHAEWKRAAEEMEARSRTTGARLVDLRVRLKNLYELAETASGAARDGFSDRINVLTAQVQQMERQERLQQKAQEPVIDADAMTLKIGALIDDLGANVNGPERDAARLKEALRSMITEVSVSPAPALGREDGRGNGPVSIKVTGSLTAMVDFSEDRVIHRRGSTSATVDHPNVGFTLYLSWAPRRQDSFEADIAIWNQMLDDADVPLTMAVLTEALEPLPENAGPALLNARDLRARRLLKYFQDSDLVGVVHWSSGIGRNAGWVWSTRAIDAATWRRRALDQPQPPLAIIGLGCPEAFVTTVGELPKHK